MWGYFKVIVCKWNLGIYFGIASKGVKWVNRYLWCSVVNVEVRISVGFVWRCLAG